MGERGQFSPKCLIEGPFGFDNAINQWAADHKGIRGPVAGKADVLIVPDIEAGNTKLASIFCAVYMSHVTRQLRLKVGKVRY